MRRVAVQQRNFGQPLDDVVVGFEDVGGQLATLSLQVKSSLTISAAPSNKDFRAIVSDAWKTIQSGDFRKQIDRVGAAVDAIAKDKAADLRLLCDVARASGSIEHFESRFLDGGNASASLKGVKADIASLLSEANGTPCLEAEVHEFLSHFVLLQFDFMHGGAVDTSNAQNQIREILADGSQAQAPLVWMTLHNLARDAAGKAGEFFRPDLLRKLTPIVRLRGAISLRPDLAKISQMSAAWRDDIEIDVGGVHLERGPLVSKLSEAMRSARFVQIKGIPGSGKSVLLRSAIDEAISKGPVVFLKADRLDGTGWQGFASANSLSSIPLSDILAEIAAVGTDTLFIDGIDRIEKQHRGIVLDILRAIATTASLSSWKVVVSLRDTAAESLRNWLGSLLDKFELTTVEVGALDEEESEQLAKARNELRPLLFGTQQVREIARRPFFAKVLCQGFSTGIEESFVPQSELDLVVNWWTRGGYNTSGQDSILRQQAIIDLAQQRAQALSQPVMVRKLSAATREVLQPLIDDGIVQYVRENHSLRFAHDIFFEWAFFNSLAAEGPNWPQIIRDCGEPPAVSRAVELLGQFEYQEGIVWETTLATLASSQMRSQWLRCWLLAPPAVPEFIGNRAQFKGAVMSNECHLLKKVLVWFQAEKTVPNPQYLAEDPTNPERIRIANLIGLPSDYPSWRRFLYFLVVEIDSVPAALYPDIVSLFEVWQNAASGFENRVSQSLLTICSNWLREADTLDDDDELEPNSRFAQLPDMKEFKNSLVRLLVSATSVYPDFITEYLTRLTTVKSRRDDRLDMLLQLFPRIATSHGQMIADLLALSLLEELPDERIAKEREKQAKTDARRAEIRLKPESSRTQVENNYLSDMFTVIGGSSFSRWDWDHLCIERFNHSFSPASPKREPFKSLFKVAPDIAIDFLKRLCNHATMAWRQLHKYDYDGVKTPLPVIIKFPWGDQEFWGGSREYRWCRAVQSPDVISCGFLALEEWCLDEIERGTPVDSVIQKIVADNQSVGVLGVAVSLAMHFNHLSEVTLALISSQFLWRADCDRMQQDWSMRSTQLMGFNGVADSEHIDAVKALFDRIDRTKQLKTFAPGFIFSAEFAEAAREQIGMFENVLPYEYGEDQSSDDVTMLLGRDAREFSQLAKVENWKAIGPPDADGLVPVRHVDPDKNTPERLAEMARAREMFGDHSLYTWVAGIFDGAKQDDLAKIGAAIEVARKLDDGRLLGADADVTESLAIRRGAVTGTAAVILQFRENVGADDLDWARSVITRAAETLEETSPYLVPSSSMPWHQGIFAARGFAADMLAGTAIEDADEWLLALITHPLHEVSNVAFQMACRLWTQAPKLTWACLRLGLSQCVINVRSVPGELPEPVHERRVRLFNESLEFYHGASPWVALPKLPDAWTTMKDVHGSRDDLPEGSIHGTVLAPPAKTWDSERAAKLVRLIPFAAMLASDAAPMLLTFLQDALAWTIAKKNPPKSRSGRRGNAEHIFTWTRSMGTAFGISAGALTTAEIQTLFLDPVFALDDKECWELLAPFCNVYSALYVADSEIVVPNVIQILNICQAKLLSANEFNPQSYRRGRLHGWDMPDVLRSMMFVYESKANGAVRFANGDWSDVALILPLIDNFIFAAGWSVTVMGHFITLCERSIQHYPIERFADQVLFVLKGQVGLDEWRGTWLASKLAGLVHQFSIRETQLTPAIGQKMLRILDALVDTGDRRSAALQQGEVFREIVVA